MFFFYNTVLYSIVSLLPVRISIEYARAVLLNLFSLTVHYYRLFISKPMLRCAGKKTTQKHIAISV